MRIKEANAHLAKFKKTLEEKQKSQAVKNMNTGDGIDYFSMSGNIKLI